ncbi:uncharacterized protein ASPGLDRAFT_40275 [Aspergillus glaucus CBS 516.65]|uniref:Uncharacterized protein n=1 Tax=Aspergillus glaucus CBS 516.65 TaxID=1160497 RepID=A0A1L9V4Z3_ASPGL|nr:hypothetical protein ASPGLDRAFT_40275 [Aspergillus glaucus CBS 516.65]OJJ79013.1 hypothetical protein ASPGLDRAFT_40275 [Aspergillus glaucus CBS 516.65]
MNSQKEHPSVDAHPPSTHLLLEKPRKWTPAHVQAANVKLIPHVSAEKLVDSHYFPKDGDKGFKRSVGLFSKSVFDQDCTDNREDRFRFGRILGIFEEVLEVPVPSHLHPHIEFLQSIIEASFLIKGGWELSVRQSSKILPRYTSFKYL